MPKLYTTPTLYDEVHTITTSRLKEWGYLESNKIYNNASITWSRNGNKTSVMTIHTNTVSDRPYIEFDYKFRNEPRKYKVYFETIKANIGNGLIWFFVCPRTNKRCRKLYLINGYLLHREAFKNCMYSSQTQSKNYRGLEKVYGSYFKLDNLYSQLYKKNFKKTYAGKPTKRYLKLMKQIKQAERITHEEVTEMMLM